MEINKVRELGAAELREEARKVAEQLFRIRFQMKLGQTEGIKNLRSLKKDVARLRTVERERALGIRGTSSPLAATAGATGTIGITGTKGRQVGAGKASE